MTVNEAIRALTDLRDRYDGRHPGGAPLLMADGRHVVGFEVNAGGYVYVCDSAEPGQALLEKDAREFLRRYGTDLVGMTRAEVLGRLKEEGESPVWTVLAFVLGSCQARLAEGQPCRPAAIPAVAGPADINSLLDAMGG